MSPINHPIRITDSLATVLDHMLASANSSCLIKSAIISDQIFDHLSIICCASIGALKYRTDQKKRNMSSQNIPKFVETLENTDKTDILSISDPNVALDNFMNQFNAILNCLLPSLFKNLNSKTFGMTMSCTICYKNSNIFLQNLEKKNLLRLMSITTKPENNIFIYFQPKKN